MYVGPQKFEEQHIGKKLHCRDCLGALLQVQKVPIRSRCSTLRRFVELKRVALTTAEIRISCGTHVRQLFRQSM